MKHTVTEKPIHNVTLGPIMTIIATTNFIAMMNTIAIAIVLPVFMREFHTDITAVQWLVTGYMLATCIIAPVVGFISDWIGLKKTFIVAVVGFAVITLAIGCANHMTVIIFLRVLQGLFGGMLMPLTQSMIYQVFPRQQQNQAVSIWATALLLAPTIAPSLGGLIADFLNWRYIFFLQVPIMICVIIGTIFLIPAYHSKPADQARVPFDFVGLLLSIVGSLSLLVAFSNITTWGLTSPKVIGLSALGIVALALFFRVEYTKEHPMLYARVFSYEGFFSSIVLMCVGMMMTNTSNNILPIYLQNVLGLNTTQAALVMLPAPLIIMAIMPLMGKYYDIIGPQKLLFGSMVFGVISCFLLGAMNAASSILFIIMAIIVRDLGGGTTNMPGTNMAMQAIPPEYATHAAAMISWMKQCVTALAIGLANTFMSYRTAYYMEEYTALDSTLQYQLSYCGALDDYYHLFTVFFLIGFVAIYFSKSRKKTN